MPRELLVEEEKIGPARLEDDQDRVSRRQTVTVTLVMGTSGFRTVTLPFEQVNDRSVQEVIEATAAALNQGEVPDQVFGGAALQMLDDSNTAVHHVLGPDHDEPLRRSHRVSVTLGQPLCFALYTDHVGGEI